MTFTDLSTGAITAWAWDFGDGGTSTLASPMHTYTTDGTYTVALTVTGPGGMDTDTQVDVITVNVPPLPVAGFSANPLSGDFPLEVNFSDLSTGAITDYAWDFGDGGTSTLASPMHTYTTDGTYTVALTVTGPGGMDTDTQVDVITVNVPPPPIAGFSANPLSGIFPLEVSFSDLSTGTITDYAWDFGDSGTSTEASPAHTYTAAGEYTVSLTVTGPGGMDTSVQTDLISVVFPPPVAEFSADFTGGVFPLDVQFSDLSSGEVSSYAWDFGDGNTSTLQDPMNTYASPGDYTVALMVTGAGGNDTETKVDYIVVTGLPPVAGFTATPTTGVAPLDVDFTNTTTGSADTWFWDFGDGGTSTLADPSYTYASPGMFSVALTASGPGGSDVSTQVDLVTVDPTPPILAVGEVISHQKVSATVGGVLPALDAGDQFGRGVAPLGDVDGDGVIDLAVGVQKDDDGGTAGAASEVGAVWILFMNTDGTTKALQKISATAGGFTAILEDGDEFGRAVGAPGDVDNDGTPDLLAGAAGDDDGGSDRGAFYVLFLNPDGTVRDHEKTSSDSALFAGLLGNGDEFGRSFACLEDLDGDLVGDIAVGTPGDDDAGANAGAVYVVFLNADGSAKSQVKISEAQAGFTGNLVPNDGFGFSVGNVGDLNGDGVPDLGVGATGTDVGGNGTGGLWLLGMTTSGTVLGFERVTNARGLTGQLDPGDQFGYDVVGIGDIDFDGVPDLAASAALDDDGGPNRGAVYVLLMNLGGTVKSFQKISASQGNLGADLDNADQFGASLAFLGDLTRDGYGDLCVGARLDDDGFSEAGAIYVLALQGVGIPPTAAFEASSPTTGISPLLVSFQDRSTGSVASWAWDFGDGGTSTLENPAHAYSAPGLYTVSLTVGGPGGVDTATQVDLVDVFLPGPPIPDFSGTPLAGIAPLSVDFTDQSIGQVTEWLWDFGDGGSSTLQHPSHEFLLPGDYTVGLTATGPGGGATETKIAYVAVGEPPPAADFSASPTSGIVALDVDFPDLSSGNVGSWDWDFGDGGTSSLQNPSHTYSGVGTYDVVLTATGPGGSDVETKLAYITVHPPAPLAGFSALPTGGDAPLEVAFTNATTGVASGYSWSFGDGGSSTEVDPNHVYHTPGTYTVALTAVGPGGMTTDTQNNLISVTTPPPPLADFSGSPTSGDAPLGVNFTDLSAGAVSSYAWAFGDGGTSSSQSPMHVYANPGTYTVALTVTGPGGGDTQTKVDYVTADVPPAPVAALGANPTSGPASLSVDFTDLSTGNVTAWAWDFGDMGTSTEQNPTHLYTTPGTYDVSLMVTGLGGSDSAQMIGFIEVTDPPPIANFVGNVLSGGDPLMVDFTDLTTGNVTSWAWDFGDSGTSTLQNPSHSFVAPGSYSVSLTAMGPGGGHTATKTDYIAVLPPAPVADFDASPLSGFAPLSVDFTDQTTGMVDAWSWDFGDGNTSTEQNPSHVYQLGGIFTVALTATGPGGSHVKTEVDLISAGGCSGATSTFTRINNVRYRAGYTGGCNASAPCADVFIPDNPLPCAPTVLFLHGGGFVMGTKGGYAPNAIALAQMGIYVVVPNYQLATYDPCGGGSGSGSYPQAVIDTKDAVDWIHRVGTLQFGLPDTVVVAGTSSGGILAGVVGATQGPGEGFFDSDPQGDYGVDLVVLFSALGNFVSLGCEGNVWSSACETLCPGPDGACGFEDGCEFTGGYASGYPCLADSNNCREVTGIERFLGESWPHLSTPLNVDCGDPLVLPMTSPSMPTGLGWYDANPFFWISGRSPRSTSTIRCVIPWLPSR